MTEQEQPSHDPDRRPKVPVAVQKAPKEPLEDPMSSSRGLQEDPQGGAQHGPKMIPRWPQYDPRRLPGPSKDVLKERGGNVRTPSGAL